MTANTPSNNAPVFYTRDSEQYKGTKVAVWANDKPAAEGKAPAQYRGQIGEVDVQLWEASSPRGVFFNVKRSVGDKLEQIGTANAYINNNSFNSLSISFKFASEADAIAAKESMGLKENVKPFKESFYVNVYADVSRRAIEANPEEFQRLGFKTDMAPRGAGARP